MIISAKKMSLTDIVLDYCEQQQLSIDEADIQHLNYIILTRKKYIGVMIRDWKRAIGINVVIQADRVKNSTKKISQVIIITNSYSAHAKSFADKINIPIFRGWDSFKLVSNTE